MSVLDDDTRMHRYFVFLTRAIALILSRDFLAYGSLDMIAVFGLFKVSPKMASSPSKASRILSSSSLLSIIASRSYAKAKIYMDLTADFTTMLLINASSG